MAPTVRECTGCPVPHSFTQVKEYVRYRLDDLPFTTARKITHLRCDSCSGIMSPDDNKEFNADLAKNRQFVMEQDNMYKYHEGVNMDIIPLKGYAGTERFLLEVYFKESSKQWHKGAIHYLKFITVNDVVKIVPSIKPFQIYCNEEDVLSIAAKQFVKPDDYFKLTSIEAYYNPTRLSPLSHLPVVGTLD